MKPVVVRGVLAIVAGVAACAALEERTVRFLSVDEMNPQERAWVQPLQIPQSAQDIVLTTDLDINAVSISFRISDSADLTAYAGLFETVDEIAASCGFAKSLGPDWQRLHFRRQLLRQR